MAASREDNLIARYFRPLATDPGAFGLTDDAAVLKADGFDIVVNTDAIVEGVHFLPDDPADTIARKALRVNLSDLAAKGATPAGFVLTLALRDTDEAWLSEFARGLGEDAAAFGCPLLGGDTVSTPGPLMISVTALGRVPVGKMVRRFGAAVGDLVVVTGSIGDAALGLAVLQDGAVATALSEEPAMRDALVSRYRVPQPRSALATAVRNHASAAMDVSDGLVGDLAKLLSASGAGAEIDLERVPFSTAARAAVMADPALAELAWTGGDDYEILCTASEREYPALAAAAKSVGMALTPIGRVTEEAGVARYREQGRARSFAQGSFAHF